MNIKPSKCLCIHALDGFETFKMDDETIGVRPIWFDAKKQPPPPFKDVILYAAGLFYIGWNESCHPGEDPVYCLSIHDGCYAVCLEGVTHWMQIPNLPKGKNNELQIDEKTSN